MLHCCIHTQWQQIVLHLRSNKYNLVRVESVIVLFHSIETLRVRRSFESCLPSVTDSGSCESKISVGNICFHSTYVRPKCSCHPRLASWWLCNVTATHIRYHTECMNVFTAPQKFVYAYSCEYVVSLSVPRSENRKQNTNIMNMKFVGSQIYQKLFSTIFWLWCCLNPSHWIYSAFLIFGELALTFAICHSLYVYRSGTRRIFNCYNSIYVSWT